MSIYQIDIFQSHQMDIFNHLYQMDILQPIFQRLTEIIFSFFGCIFQASARPI